MSVRHLLGVLAVVSVTWAVAAPTSACSPLRSCRILRGVEPSDGDYEVPRNIELRVRYGVALREKEVPPPILETTEGVVVPTQWSRPSQDSMTGAESWRGKPDALLAAGTRYRIRHAYGGCVSPDGGTPSGPAQCQLCPSTTGRVISEFLTGDRILDEHPTAPVLGELSPLDVWPIQFTTCGEWGRCSYRLPISGVPNIMLLRVYRDDVWLADFNDPVDELSIGRVNRTSIDDPDIFGEGAFQLHAVDRAGNRSPAATITVPRCEIPEMFIDAGTLAQDSGVTPTEEPVVTSDDGCALASSSSPWTALGLLALLRRRQTRSR